MTAGESPFRGILKNALKVASGKAASGVFGLLVLLLAGWGLSPAKFGVLTLLFAYVSFAAAIGNCNAWQVVLHYGAGFRQRGEQDGSQDALAFALGLDVVTGFAVTAAALLGVVLFRKYMGISSRHELLALLVCTLIWGKCFSSFSGILRLYDRVDVIAKQQGCMPLLKLVLTFCAWRVDMGLTAYVVAWYIAELCGQVWLLWASWKLVLADGLRFSPSLALVKAGRKLPEGLWNMVWASSVSGMLQTVWKPVTMLILGAVCGLEAAGLYNVARRFVDAFRQPAVLIEQNYYPEMAVLDPRKDSTWRLALKFSAVSAAIGLAATLLVFVGGKPVIFLFGPSYGEVAGLMAWMAPSLIVELAVLPSEAIFYATGQALPLLGLEAVGTSVYFCLLLVLSHLGGVAGAAQAYMWGNFVDGFLMFGLALRTWIRRAQLVPLTDRPARGKGKKRRSLLPSPENVSPFLNP